MIFQWYVFVLLICVAFFAKLSGQTYTVNLYGQSQERYGWIPVLAIMLPLIYWAGTREDMKFGDTSAYRSEFLGLPSTLRDLPEYFTEESKDRGLSSKVCKFFYFFRWSY